MGVIEESAPVVAAGASGAAAPDAACAPASAAAGGRRAARRRCCSREALGKLAGFAAFAWLARALDPVSYGAVELAVALSMFFMLVVDFGLGPIGARAIARDPASAPALAASIPAARLGLSLIAVGGMIVTVFVMRQPADSTQLSMAFALGIVATAWASRWLFQGLDRMGWAALPQALRMGVFALGVAIVVRGDADLWKVGVVEIVAAWGMAAYFILVQQVVVCPVRLDFRWSTLRPLLAEAAPVGLSQLVWAVNQYLPTVLIAWLIGGAATAWYGGAHRIVMSVGTFVWLYHFNLFPSLVRAHEAGGSALTDLLARSFRVSSWCGIAAGLIASVFASEICRIAYGDAFEAAALPFTVIAWAMPVSLISGHARFALIATGNQRQELFAQCCGAVLTLVLGLSLVPFLGPVGGALGMLASCIVNWLVAHACATARIGPLPFLAALARPAAAALAAFGTARLFDAYGALAAGGAAIGSTSRCVLPRRALLDDLRALRRERVMTRNAPAPRPIEPARPARLSTAAALPLGWIVFSALRDNIARGTIAFT